MKLNHTCTCDSPLITFTGFWKAEDVNISNAQAPLASVRMVSQREGDAALFNFTGTAVWVYPATNSAHGSYEVYLDGALSRFNGSRSVDITLPLFQRVGLQSTPHILSIHNTGTNVTTNPAYLDLAAITWEEQDRYGNASSFAVEEDDNTASTFAWYPFDEWMVQSQTMIDDSPMQGFSPNRTVSFHVTNASDAWMQYNFSANSTSIYGTVGTSQGPYSAFLEYVSEDGETNQDYDNYYDLPPEQLLNASFPFNRTGVLLFHVSNINSSRVTTLTMKNHPDKQYDSLSIDYSVTAIYSGDSSPSTMRRKLPVGTILGAVLGSIALVKILALGVYLLQRRRQVKLIRKQNMNVFRDSLIKRGILPILDSPNKSPLDEEVPK